MEDKILVRTAFFKGTNEKGEKEKNVEGRFIKKETLNIFASKKKGKNITKTQTVCQIKVLGSEVKDMVSHEILEKDAKSEMLKKRFAEAWKRFEELQGAESTGKSLDADTDPDTDNEEVSAKKTGDGTDAGTGKQNS
jgi:hypothetical protein